MAARPAVQPIATPTARRTIRLTRDPFVHFLVLGLVLLVLHGLVSPPRPVPPDHEIQLTSDDLDQLRLAWTARWQRPPTEAEMQGLVEQKVREEVLYREAIAMGLDQGDTIVKRRLAQKLEFLTEDLAAIRDPTDAELRAWFAGNAVMFATPAHFTFSHIYFSPDARGERAESDARAALTQLDLAHAGHQGVGGYGDAFSDRSYYADRTPDQLAAQFGSRFPAALAQMQPGGWRGPVESGLGWHLVWVAASSPAHVPTWAEADPAEVRAAWIDEQRERSRRAAFQAMRARYEVVLPDGAP